MLENKYFCPDLEDLFIGYECESICSDFLEGFIWQKCIISKDSFKYNENTNTYRTRFLTKQDLESEGWKKCDNSYYYYKPIPGVIYNKEIQEYFNEKNELVSYGDREIYYNTDTLELIISTEDQVYNAYNGQAKSINEFRKICKWLDIK